MEKPLKRLIATACFAWAACAVAHASALPDYPFVSTSGKARTWLKPDIGEIQFDAATQRLHADAANAAMDTLSAALLQLLGERGVADGDVDSFEVSKKPVELSRPADDGTLASAAITRRFRVQVRDLTQWPAMIAALLAQEGVESLSVRFDRSDRDEVDARLAGEAAKDARVRGSQLAEAMGRHLGAAAAISQGALGQVAAPFGLAESGATSGPARSGRPAGAAGDTPSYAVPNALSFEQAVNVIFRLK